MTYQEFFIKANLIHNNFYDYSKVVFTKMSDEIIIICPKHGEFKQKVSVHINDRCGCPKCGEEKKREKRKSKTFFNEARTIHGNKYDYSNSKYENSHIKIEIKCNICGLVFWMRPYAHIQKKNPQGCRVCGYANRLIPHKGTTEKFLTKAKDKWGEKYKYPNTNYVNKYTKIEYECPLHGVIWQFPKLHVKSGCPYCNGRGISRHTTETFKAIANIIHNFTYDYSFVELLRITDYIEIICRKHGVFSQRANNHIHLHNGCPQCDIEKRSSKAEKDVLEFIKTLYAGEILENDRKLLGGKEIDIYIPGLKIGFEYHGMYYHVETVKGKKSHWDKANIANGLGIQLIQIYEWEWKNKRKLVESKIKSLLGKSNRIYARKTEIIKLNKNEKNEFLDGSHIQGRDSTSIAYGLKYEGKIVACMTFGVSRFNKKYDWELVRYSSAVDVTVIGGAAKLLKAFRKEYSGSIISYADRRWSVGNLYYKLGFKLDGTSNPGFSYFHINKGELHNRMNFQKKKLTKMPHYDISLKEYEIMQLNGYDRIWDAGQYRFVIGQ